MKEFKSFFYNEKEPIIVDDVAVKFLKKKEINYKIIQKTIQINGEELIKLDINFKKHHKFEALCSFKLNDSISYFVFSHRVMNNMGKYNYTAHLAIFNYEKLKWFSCIYSNTNDKLYKYNFGSVLNRNTILKFRAENLIFENFVINKQGTVIEEEDYNFKLDKTEITNYIRQRDSLSKYLKKERDLVLYPMDNMSN